MRALYTTYNELTKDILDQIVVGDLVRCNDWRRPYRVVAVSNTHIILVSTHPSADYMYSIIEKSPSPYSRNAFTKGSFRCGPDDHYCFYNYTDIDDCNQALDRLADGLKLIQRAHMTDAAEQTSGFIEGAVELSKATQEYGQLELSSRKSVNLKSISFRHTEYTAENIKKWLNRVFTGSNNETSNI